MNPPLIDDFKERYINIPFATYKGDYIGKNMRNDMNTFSHHHKEIEILIVFEGKLTCFIDSQTVNAEKGDIIIVPPFTAHHYKLYKNTACMHKCVCFDMSLIHDKKLQNGLENKSLTLNSLLSHREPFSDKAFSCIDNAYNAYEKQENGWELSVVGNLNLFFSYIKKCDFIKNSSSVNNTNRIFTETINYIEEKYRESITSSEISKKLFISESYFCRIFKIHFGCNFQNYVCMYRIEKAKEMLLNRAVSISESAVFVGFNSFSYFSKMFKKYTGYTPTQYRNINTSAADRSGD